MNKFIFFLFVTTCFCILACGGDKSSESNPFLPEEKFSSEIEIISSSSSMEVSSSSEIALSSSEVFSSSSKIESSSSMEVSSSSEIALSSSEVFSSSSKIESSSSMEVSSSSEIALSSSEVFSSSSKIESSSSMEVSSSSEIALSSSEVFSSSSKIESSSSEKIPSKIYDCSEYECITTAYLNPEIEYGEFLDTRDNQVYRTVQIGEQTWMAQNLNYNTMGSICPLQKDSLCYLYGRLYKWTDAIYACPTGWHLPNADDYQELHNYVEEHNNDLPVGTSLKFGENNIWGFSGLLAGCRTRIGADSEYQWYAYFWTSTETEDGKAKVRLLIKDKDYFGYNTRDKEDWVSVRCIKD